MDDDMDIDLVIEEEDPEIAQMRAEAQAMHERAQAAEAEFEAMNGVEDAPEEGEVDGTAAIPNKLHIRGLDSMTTADIRAFVKEHYNTEPCKRVEWIDDTSANMIFESDQIAADALQALSADPTTDPLELRRTRVDSAHPNTSLEMRLAVAADVKLPGAKDRSRFYLMNPEYDPDLRGTRKRRYGDDGGRSYKKRRNEDDRYNRRGSDVGPAFSADMYDDSTGIDVPEVRPSSAEVREKRHQMEDLFKHRKPSAVNTRTNSRNGRLRDRSASPARDGDGKYGFDKEQPYRRTARQRSATPPHLRKARRREHGEEDVNRAKELFPEKANVVHKRSDAQNLHPDQVADIVGQYNLTEAEDDRAYDMLGDEPTTRSAPKGDLFSRISGPRQADRGRLNGSKNGNLEGFSILGAAKDRVENPLVKELFPMKAALQEGKKDLFDGRIKGRATQRHRAEDLF